MANISTYFRREFAACLVALSCSTPVLSVEVGQPAPDFERVDGKDQSIKLSSYLGKVVYLDFWASWCVPCRETFPWMNQLQAKFGNDGFQVVAVNIDTKKVDADKFLAKFPPAFTILFDPTRGVAKSYELKGVPSSYLIDRAGNLVSVQIGFSKPREAEFEARIEKLLSDTKN